MKAALLGDVHANLPALEAVLSHAHQQEVDDIWNIGDFVGYGAFPNEVVKLLRQNGTKSIIGNYDIKVLEFPEKKSKWRKSKRSQKFTAFKWASKNLKKSNRHYLSELPDELRMEVEGWQVLLVHGSPVSNEEPLTIHTPDERLVELARLAQAELIVCGHSHQPFARQVAGTWFINTGSVGRPGDGDPRACYALLELSPGSISVEHFRIEYDVTRAAEAIRQAGMPEVFAQMILQGWDLDTVLEEEDSP
ncbi:MAG: metallophosphoesterase family protein [Anaerolineales bacterium]